EPVAQTDANGRFTIATAPTTPLRLYAQRLDYAIPAGTETLDLGDVPYPPLQSLILSPDDYPPSATPYWIEAGDFWLVHTPEGELFAFAPLSPAYAEAIDVDECHYTWDETGSRFVDPCSGDEWELNGMLNLEQSTELWSNRDLDQFYVGMQEGFIFVQFTGLIQGQPVSERPLAVDAHTGITVTAVTAIYSPTATTIDMVTLVDPIWQMNPTAFPQQIAHLHFTMPDALIDDQGRSTAPVSQEGEPAVFDAATGGLRGMMHNQLEAIAADSETITVTMTMELLNLARQLELPLVWEGHQVGDVWDVAVPLEIGYAGAQIEQVEWLETLPDDSARLNLTVTDASPEDIRLYCLHLTTSTPEEQTCPNFDGDLTYTIDVQPGEPVELYVLAWLELKRPFTLVLDVP
ncbi:MAG: hypothetical protein IAF02_13125, partial [Anaerolineae bacterium]|nr:hypothetical protein [Anaerolineae bacterium]